MRKFDVRIRNKIIELSQKGLSIRTITDEIERTIKKISNSYVHKVLKEEDLNRGTNKDYKLTIIGKKREYFNNAKDAFKEGIDILDDPEVKARTMEIKKL